ncbi:MAG TPA: class D sortase [Thermoanaerobaculia bacterium]|nr:class D sortase [Thermoanaerobaculia bacterium]
MPHILKESLSRRGTLLLWVERLLLAVGLLCLGLVAFAVIDARWFAFQQGRRLDRALRERAAAGQDAGSRGGPGAARRAPSASDTDRLYSFRPGPAPAPPPAPAPEGTVLGRIEIPRVGISSLVLEGIGGESLRRGVGHIPGTGLTQAAGNVGLAGHRDTVFRGLKDIRKGDRIDLETLDGTYHYSVDWAQVVDPDDVGVLAVGNRPELTMVTCYPFYYVGSAPERFVVRAHLLGGGTAEGTSAKPAAAAAAPPAAAVAVGKSGS